MPSDADNIIALYQRHGRAWARKRCTALFEADWLQQFVDLMPPQKTVLDLGCGSGIPMAASLMAQGCHVTGIDTSSELLQLAQQHLPDATWHLADMRSLTLEGTFSGVLAWNSFFHLAPDDQRHMFAVFEKHVTAGAALLFTSGPDEGERIGVFEGAPLYHASLSPDAYRTLLDHHGFDVIRHVIEDPDCGGHTVWLARFRGASEPG